MSLLAEFRLPSNDFALGTALETVPDARIEFECIVAGGENVTPYVWCSSTDQDRFAAALRGDDTVGSFDQLDAFDETSLYRIHWGEDLDSPITADCHAAILEATAGSDGWTIRTRFDDTNALSRTCDRWSQHGVSFDLRQLHDLTRPNRSGEFGLTPKQHEALLVAWEMGYFDLPSPVTMAEVAQAVGISQQSLSQRLQRAHKTLIENTIAPSATE